MVYLTMADDKKTLQESFYEDLDHHGKFQSGCSFWSLVLLLIISIIIAWVIIFIFL